MKTTKRKRIMIIAVLLLAGSAVLFFTQTVSIPSGLPAHSPSSGQLNPDLPDARNTAHPGWSKLDYYHQADADSAKRKAEEARDPYYVLPEMPRNEADKQADALTQQLDALNRQLQQPAAAPAKYPASTRRAIPSPADTHEWQARNYAMQRPTVAKDPEMEQLNGMLEKIMDIKYPDRLKRHDQETDANVNANTYLIFVPWDTLLEGKGANGFYSLDEPVAERRNDNAFTAIVTNAQTLVSGAIIQLRLGQAVVINRQTIPADHLVYGTVQLNGERLLVTIEYIRVGQSLLPVKLAVYDADGLPGIYVPGAITRDVAKQSAGQSLSAFGLSSLDPSLGAQAAGAGIQAAKNLLQRKVQQVKVTVPAGYVVLLKNS
jgi:hypothetical protein